MSRVERVPTDIQVPDGTYTGRWAGNQVAHEVEGEAIVWEADVSLAGSCPVRFAVRDGRLDNRSIEQVGISDGKHLLDGIGSPASNTRQPEDES